MFQICVVNWRWVQHEPLKLWCLTPTLHGVTTQNEMKVGAAWTSENSVSYPNTIRSYSPKWSEDGGNMDFWNVGILPQYYTASQPMVKWKSQSSKYKQIHILEPLFTVISNADDTHSCSDQELFTKKKFRELVLTSNKLNPLHWLNCLVFNYVK